MACGTCFLNGIERRWAVRACANAYESWSSRFLRGGARGGGPADMVSLRRTGTWCPNPVGTQRVAETTRRVCESGLDSRIGDAGFGQLISDGAASGLPQGNCCPGYLGVLVVPRQRERGWMVGVFGLSLFPAAGGNWWSGSDRECDFSAGSAWSCLPRSSTPWKRHPKAGSANSIRFVWIACNPDSLVLVYRRCCCDEGKKEGNAGLQRKSAKAMPWKVPVTAPECPVTLDLAKRQGGARSSR